MEPSDRIAAVVRMLRIVFGVGAALTLSALAAAAAPIRELHFSQDGRFILAEEEDDVVILTTQPLAVLFRIDCPERDGRSVHG